MVTKHEEREEAQELEDEHTHEVRDDEDGDVVSSSGKSSKDSKCGPRLTAVYAAIRDVEPPGDYFATGMRVASPPPGLVVEGLGDIAPPLGEVMAKLLIAKCHLAPYGHSEKTLVDTNVRNTWELSANEFALTNKAWESFVKNEIVPACRLPLGIHKDFPFEAKLYKMLLYEEGGKFEQHQDSEKEDGMFGTLVVVLPGRFVGGELIVHDPSDAETASSTCDELSSRFHVWSPDAMDPFAVKYAAFYGDCPLEVKPVTKGIGCV